MSDDPRQAQGLGPFVTEFVTDAARARGQWLSMGIFIAFVVIALMANWSLFLQWAGMVAALVFLHNGLALAGGNTLARIVGLSEFDRRAITIETGIQNSGLGLVLIFVFVISGVATKLGEWSKGAEILTSLVQSARNEESGSDNS